MSTRQMFTAAAVFCWVGFAVAAGAQERMAEIRRLAETGDSGRALTALRGVLAENPDDSEALFLRGVLLFESGRVGAARAAFEGLIESHPDFPEAYNNLAVIQAAEGDYEAATETLKQGLGTDASYQAAYENLTRIFAQLASEAYGRALEIESPERKPVDLVFLSALSNPPPTLTEPAAESPAQDPPVVAAAPTTKAPVMAPEPEPEPEPEQGPTEVAESAPVEESDLPAVASVGEEAGAGDVGETVAAWARAWSEQRSDDYLAFYAPGYSPSEDMSHEEWAALRRERLARPEYIRVDVAILDSTVVGDSRATVTFMQAYESDRFSDQVTKTLELERRDEGGWMIVRETAEP